jgi:flagellar protein FliS
MSTKAAQLKHYRNVGLYGDVSEASPHQSIELLFGGLLQSIVLARGHMDRGEVNDKGEQVGRALRVVEGLILSLDHDQGGEVAGNLLKLYDYIAGLLVRANASNDPALFDEATRLVREISSAWSDIPLDLRNAGT